MCVLDRIPSAFINRGLEGYRGDQTNAGHRHQLLANGIVAGHQLHATVRLKVG